MFGSCSFHRTLRNLERAAPTVPRRRQGRKGGPSDARFKRLRLVRRKRRRRVPVPWAEHWLVYAAVLFGLVASIYAFTFILAG